MVPMNPIYITIIMICIYIAVFVWCTWCNCRYVFSYCITFSPKLLANRLQNIMLFIYLCHTCEILKEFKNHLRWLGSRFCQYQEIKKEFSLIERIIYRAVKRFNKNTASRWIKSKDKSHCPFSSHISFKF